MSIAVLTQVYTEARRLAVAGSIVARGDFRLKKLLTPLQDLSKAAPVFAKIHEAATAVVEGPEDKSAESLLELTSLVNAVLYTQGETAVEGKLEPVETTELNAPSVPTSARVLKPLLEALTNTGSGRLELIKDAVERGLFRDMRLVKPAIGGLDDPYAEIADLLAEKVLPLYGTAMLPELRAKYDPKGTKGHPRRLKLMHTLDPAGTRELVKAALDGGSKEVKVAAISCLGSAPEDLNFLIEQASAKAQDVRVAAYEALAKVNDPAALAVLQKALNGKDYMQAANAIEAGKHPKFVDVMLAEIQSGVDALPKQKDKKATSALVDRVTHFIASIPSGEHPAAEAVLLDLFARRDELAKIKGDGMSGADITETVVQQMADQSAATKRALVARHAEVPPNQLDCVFLAARDVLKPKELFDTFSPYLTAKIDPKKKAKDPASQQRDEVMSAIMQGTHWYSWDDEPDPDEDDEDAKKPPFDPRWLDLAVEQQEFGLVRALARPGHPGALAFAKAAFDAAFKKAKTPDDVDDQVFLLLRLGHPAAEEAYFAALGKRPKKGYFYRMWWFIRMAEKLPPKTALPRLEAFVTGLPENEQDAWLDPIEKLRRKT